jgi:putative ATP-dependent endonuclease of the OLD family
MFIEQIDIKGFRGIKQISLKLNAKSSVLIGENQWGKSSLISALKLLSLENKFYQFVDSDFYDDRDDGHHISINVVYCESYPNQLSEQAYQPLQAVSFSSQLDDLYRITYQICAKKSGNDGDIITEHHLLGEDGQPLKQADPKSLIAMLINLNPVMPLKNSIDAKDLPVTNQPLSQYYIEQLATQLKAHSAQLSQDELNRGLQAARYLLEYYFVDTQQRDKYKQRVKQNRPRNEDWNSLERINNVLDNLDNDYLRTALLGLFGSLVNAKGNNPLSGSSVPILVLEEPESQLHPIILSVGFRLLKNLPTQKMITSNSSDLVSLFPLECIYRLIRLPEQIVTKYVEPHSLSVGDSRRILFHVLYRRPTALFARCWLLVEGETEVLLLRELAEQSGYHLSSEGVQLIEFAQCGLKPLINYASKMGIRWHVMTDGDMAGKKYAETVQSQCPPDENLDDYITVLPARDIENFLFKHGFSHVYKLAAYNTVAHIDMSVPNIIQKAIHKSSKPDLAIAVCDDAKQRGVTAIPKLLTDTFAKLVKASNALV